MIELSQIPATSKLKELRSQINTMANEINTGQMVIGQVLHPTAQLYSDNVPVVNVTAASWQVNQLFAVCLPESNGVYVAQVFGCLDAFVESSATFDKVVIDIAGVKLPNSEDEVSAFATPEHLGFTPYAERTICNTGLQFSIVVADGNHTTVGVTDAALSSNSANLLLNRQELIVRPLKSSQLILRHVVLPPASQA